jgi:hypothetical protein
MSQAVVDRGRVGGSGGERALSARVGAAAAILAMALIVYGAYGDSKASSSQKSGVPFLVVIAAVLAIVTYGVLAPLALRAVASGNAAGRRWAIGLTVVSVLGLAVFWSGLPLIVGGAAALVGRAGREQALGGKAYSVAWVLGLFAAGASIVVTVLGNILH